MPINKLFIEGNLESQILNPILQGTPVLHRGGSKNALGPRTRTERQENKVAAGYPRDRDFDYDPPTDLSRPTVDCEVDGVPIGWRWCRHEIENYMIEPALISEATAWPISDIEEAICQSALKIRNYECARWTVGIVRRALPPHYELRTRPDNLNEIALPTVLDQRNVNEWATRSIETHRSCMEATTSPQAVQETFDAFATRFDDEFVSDVNNVLLWFSGKDILAGMAEWLSSKDVSNPGEFRAKLRDWVIDNPDRALELLPEWSRLTEVFRS